MDVSVSAVRFGFETLSLVYSLTKNVTSHSADSSLNLHPLKS